MKKLLIVMLVAIMAVASLNAQNVTERSIGVVSIDSDDPQFVAELTKMLQLTNAKKNMTDAMALTWQQMGSPLTNYQQAANAVTNAIWDDVVRIYAQEYIKHFNLQDMQELNAFYESRVGKKFADASNELTQKGMQRVNQELGDKMMAIIVNYVKK